MKFKDEVKLLFDDYPSAAIKLVVISLFAGALITGILLS